MKRKGFIRQL